jgi:hypothetical protein
VAVDCCSIALCCQMLRSNLLLCAVHHTKLALTNLLLLLLL